MTDLKRDAAQAALQLVESEMFLGLGTGSTAEEFVRLLGAAIAAGQLTGIRAVCTSERTATLAKSLGIVCEAFVDQVPDLTIDGADEIDRELRLIKGRGGALLREKIIEQASRRFVVIADESKMVDRLGIGAFPIEVVRFATHRLVREFDRAGWSPKLRLSDGAEPFITDEGHHIIDVTVPSDVGLADLVAWARSHAGVVETGFFPTEATEALIAGNDGVRKITRQR